ncbi:phage portal protein, partial [Xylella fastidiosa subsp. multiplex]
ISTLPLFVYARDSQGQRELARNHRLWRVMHSKPNAYMTANVALASLCVNKVLHNNAYAQIIRNGSGI